MRGARWWAPHFGDRARALELAAIDDLAAAIPHAEVVVLDEVDHLPWLERPVAVALLVREWLAACSERERDWASGPPRPGVTRS